MDVKGKRRNTYKRNKKQLSRMLVKPTFTTAILEYTKYEGVENLYLSPLTQQILDCCIGIHITPEEPWIFVPKEKILENIELHENSSEFLPLKEEIQSYPDDKILIGCYGHQQDIPEEFMVCTTLDSAKHTLEALQEQEAAKHQKIVESIVKTCGTWISLGSETEVEDDMCVAFRKPYVVNLVSEDNTFIISCKFHFRFVADSPDGYVELLSPRETFNNVLRKRLSSYIQCSALKTNGMTQTIIEPVINKWTMCPVKMEAKKLAKNAIENFFAKVDEALLFDVLQTNYFMDLCNEDYLFQNAIEMQIYQFPLCILSFQDIFTCRGKKVSCVSWNALKSGLIATSYMKEPYSLIVSEDTQNNPSDTAFGNHVVLIWSYTDSIKPKLYLHCFREVTTVSFCSYNANIVVGGCDNGQIVVWDITGRIERGEIQKVPTREQQYHCLILEKYMTWMKKPSGVEHVYPIIYSNIEITHLSAVSYIEWLPPGEFITKNGHLEKCQVDDVHMQFLSCSKEGGRIEFWDIGVPEDVAMNAKKKRIVRLSKVPSALRKNVSPLKALATKFTPHFRILLSNPDTRKPLIISRMHEKKANIHYKVLNPETEGNIYKRTFFEFVPNKNEDAISEQKFTCVSEFGELFTIQWEGFDYDRGCQVNSVAATVSRTLTYHDGPIVVCMESPIIKDLLLTVGGRVFSIWNLSDLQVPIFWRKSAHRYVTGTWLTTHAFQFTLIRHDNYKEIWDLMEDSGGPLKIVKSKGRAIKNIYNDFWRTHSKKGTFVETNVAGEANVYSCAEDYESIKEEEIGAVINYLGNLKFNTTRFMDWVNATKGKFAVAECKVGEEEEAAAEPVLPAHQEETVEDSATRERKKSSHLVTNKWQAKEEAFMRQVLLANKNMKIDHFIENSDLVRQAEEMRTNNSKKLAELQRNMEKNMQAWRTILIPDSECFKFRKKITVSFSKDMTRFMKQSYIENYKEIEEPTVCYIKINKCKYVYNWPELHKKSKNLWNEPLLNFRTSVLDPSGIKSTSRLVE